MVVRIMCFNTDALLNDFWLLSHSANLHNILCNTQKNIICYVFLLNLLKIFNMKKKAVESSIDTQQLLKAIGAKVRMHRKQINNNYQDFAKDNNINKVTLARIENGENFTMASLIQVLTAMNMTIEVFFKKL